MKGSESYMASHVLDRAAIALERLFTKEFGIIRPESIVGMQSLKDQLASSSGGGPTTRVVIHQRLRTSAISIPR